MTLHRLFGLDLASDFPFANRLAPGSGPPDLTFTLAADAPAVPVGLTPVYESAVRGTDGESAACLYRVGDREVFHFPGIADFSLSGDTVACHPCGPRLDTAEIQFLGPVLSYCLERQSVLVLHGSCVAAAAGCGVAFLSSHGGGKSGLAAAMMTFAGCPLLTDDVLALSVGPEEAVAQPGYPQMRMWPDEAEHFLGRFEHLPCVHPSLAKRRVPVGADGFGCFAGSPVPLAAFFLPERRTDGVPEIEARPVAPAEAVIELVRHSFAPHLVEAAGLQPARLRALARLAGRVPLFRLSYPSGFEHLPRVVERVLRAVPPARG